MDNNVVMAAPGEVHIFLKYKYKVFFILPEIRLVLKVPKCEIFDLFDFNDFYVIKSL
jgi:hypothetical protein